MEKKYYHKKLIRDKIPEYIKSVGGKHETRVMENEEFEIELKRKLVEEATELQKAPKSELINELADVLQLVKSISSHNKIYFRNIEKCQVEKKKKRGAFSKKLFLVWSSAKRGK